MHQSDVWRWISTNISVISPASLSLWVAEDGGNIERKNKK